MRAEHPRRSRPSRAIPGFAAALATAVGAGVLIAACGHGGGGDAGAGLAGHAGQYYRLSEVDTPPRFEGCSGYERPHPSERHIGWVRVHFDVSPTGAVENVTVGRMSAAARQRGLGPRAQRAVSTCHFTPAVRDHQRVGVRGLTRSFSFTL